MEYRKVLMTAAVLLMVVAVFLFPSTAIVVEGPKKVSVSQTTVNHYMSLMKDYDGPSFQWPKGSEVNFTCGSQGCALAFNEKGTTALENLLTLGVGVTGVVTAIFALSGVGLPLAAVIGLVVAMFTATEAWIAFADSWGGGIGIYGGWYIGALIYYIWCNPVPSQFLPAITTTSTTVDPSTSTQSQTRTQSTTQTTTHSITYTSATACPGNPSFPCY